MASEHPSGDTDDDEYATLTLNPGYDPAPLNPLCPVCEEQIRPISNGTERRFVCGCKQVWEFSFDRAAPADSDTGYELVKGADSQKWHWLNPNGDECYCGTVKWFTITRRSDPSEHGRGCISQTCRSAFRAETKDEDDG
jgi:hypothetical protein